MIIIFGIAIPLVIVFLPICKDLGRNSQGSEVAELVVLNSKEIDAPDIP